MTKRLFLLILMGALLSGVSLAAPICSDGTLAGYIALGSAGCQIDDKLFSNFGYQGSAFGGATTIPSSGINVLPLTDIGFPGLSFSAIWSAGPGAGMDSHITYDVTVLPGGNPIIGIFASMSGFLTIGNGLVTVGETTVPDIGDLGLVHSSGLKIDSQLLMLDSPVTGPIHMTKDIGVVGNSAGIASVSGVTNKFLESQVPEPATFLLMGAGVIGLGLVRRRRVAR